MANRKPRTFLVGYTTMHVPGVTEYLEYTGQTAFKQQIDDALSNGVSLGEILCSFYAKLCYKALVLGKNDNITRTREIEENFQSVMKSGHGSVFEHCWLNFLTTDCSRVFTHELVRHRVGTAFSQTSGRYVALNADLDIVLPPELESVSQEIVQFARDIGAKAADLRERLLGDETDFGIKKKITSAIRRIAPNGQTNEIGWSCNIRSVRHMLQMRTSRHAEWEIRHVFNEVGNIIGNRYPLMLCGAKKEEIDGLVEYTNLHV